MMGKAARSCERVCQGLPGCGRVSLRAGCGIWEGLQGYLAQNKQPLPLGVQGGLAPPYRGTSLMKNAPPSRTTVGPSAQAYCRFLEGRQFLMSEVLL